MKRNARFWHFTQNGHWVKLTLKPDQFIKLDTGKQRTDEGWSRQIDEFSSDGQTVYAQFYSEGRDCDGYTSSHHSCQCPIADLASLPGSDRTYGPWEAWKHEQLTNGWIPDRPAWTDILITIDDEYAQLAGY